jgi:hypothetical protein
MPRAAAPALALLALLALLAAAAPAARASSCVTELKWAAEAQAYAKPVRVHFKGYPSFGLRSENKGTVSGSVLVTMPAGGAGGMGAAGRACAPARGARALAFRPAPPAAAP